MPTLDKQHPAEGPETSKQSVRRTEADLNRYDPERAERIRRDPPLLLDLNEAAVLARCGVRTLRDHIRRRSLSCVKLGGRVLIRRDQLLADLEKLTLKSV